MMERAAADQSPDPNSILRSRRFVGLLVIAAVLGVVASLAAWGFLELEVHLTTWVYTDLPKAFGYDDGAPLWWSLPVLGIAGVIVAFAIVRLPGRGGHIPAEGLNPSPTQPIELPGVVLAGLASISLGLVVGPEAPLLAVGGGVGLLAAQLVGRGSPAPELGAVLGGAGAFAALSLIFGNALIAAIILIEAIGLGGSRLQLVLIPGLLAAGIGSLVSIGMGSWTGLSTSAYALGPLSLPAFPRPDIADFGWTIGLAVAVAVATWVIFRLARETVRVVRPRPFLLLPAVGLLVAGLAIAFHGASGKGVNEVLFSGESALPGLVTHAGGWSLSALALLVAFKGLAYGLSLGSFRGGPTFPAMFLGAAGGLMVAQLPGFEATPAVAVGIGAGVASVLRLPLSGVVLAMLLTAQSGLGASPLIIVGVIVAYLTTLALPERQPPTAEDADAAAAEPAGRSRQAQATEGMSGSPT
jgi:chloride channel protein, CIC family